MSNQCATPYIHDNLGSLQIAFNNISPEYTIITANDTKKLTMGFVAFLTGVPEDEENAQYHYAPIYDSVEPCTEIEHTNFDSYESAFSQYMNQPDTQMYIADAPHKLSIGFSVYPNREHHFIRLHDIDVTNMKYVMLRLMLERPEHTLDNRMFNRIACG